MVAKITTGKTMRGALSYNENKVRETKAQCIAAANFGKDSPALSFHEKLNRFNGLMRWKPKVKTNTIHISLNFHPSEHPTTEMLQQIAEAYMKKIGFGDQPYLVYQHFDAAHPHVHILSTNVKKNGPAIDLHNIGRLRSEPARLSIEKEFNLLPASETKAGQSVDSKVPLYGTSETRRSIVNFVSIVARSYRYTSLPELNAALSQFNIAAHRGNECSLMFQKGGLVYSFINEEGKPVGVPVKASAIHFKPTLRYLDRQFKLNEALRSQSRGDLIHRITAALKGRPTLTELQARLSREKVFLLFRRSKDGRVFGVTFIDNKTKTVFNGSDLSKELGAKGLFEKLKAHALAAPSLSEGKAEHTYTKPSPSETIDTGLLKDLIDVQHEVESIPPHAFRKRKKKRSRRIR